MQDRVSRFFVTFSFVSIFMPNLLNLHLQCVKAQGAANGYNVESLIGNQQPAITPALFGKSANQPARFGVEILSVEAQQLLTLLDESKPEKGGSSRTRKCLDRLEKLQALYTTTGKLDEAFVLRENVEEFLARQAGLEPDPGNLTAFRNQTSQPHIFRVTGRMTGSVWGSGIYTDDSDLGTAAVHAGLLRDGQRGAVKVTLLPGQEHYEESEANGISSRSYETWQGSYSIARGVGQTDTRDATMPADARKLVDELLQSKGQVNASQIWQAMDSLQKLLASAQQAQKLDEALAIREGVRALIIKMVGALPDPGRLTSFRAQTWKSFYFVVTGRANGSLWGNGIYTDDSDLGTAVVHAGLLRVGQPGIVKVTIRPGCDEYEGSESNGVVSGSYAAFPGSYRVSVFHLPPR